MYDYQKHKEYYAKVKERKIKNTIAYTKKRLQENPEYKLRHTLGIKLSSFVRSIKGANQFLGCDIFQFIEHIECSTFTSNFKNIVGFERIQEIC